MAARALLPRLQDFEVYYTSSIIQLILIVCCWTFCMILLSSYLSITYYYFSHIICIGIFSFFPPSLLPQLFPTSFSLIIWFKRKRKNNFKANKKIIFSHSLSCFRLWSVKFLWRCFFIFIYLQSSPTHTHTHGSQNAKSQI